MNNDTKDEEEKLNKQLQEVLPDLIKGSLDAQRLIWEWIPPFFQESLRGSLTDHEKLSDAINLGLMNFMDHCGRTSASRCEMPRPRLRRAASSACRRSKSTAACSGAWIRSTCSSPTCAATAGSIRRSGTPPATHRPACSAAARPSSAARECGPGARPGSAADGHRGPRRAAATPHAPMPRRTVQPSGDARGFHGGSNLTYHFYCHPQVLISAHVFDR